MKVPLSYTWRSLWTRRLTTILTLSGISLVVFVFAAVFMMANGVQHAMVETGADENIIALRKSATSELVSQVDRNAANVIKTFPQIATDPQGKPLVTTEVLVVINLYKKKTNALSNVSVRGISPEAMLIRPQVKIIEGRMFQFGTHEIIVGISVANRFNGCDVGKQITFNADTWTIVGLFDAGGTASESEIWSDVEQLMPSVGRPVFSSITFRLKSIDQLDAAKSSLEKDPRVQYLNFKREREFYEEQSHALAFFIEFLGSVIWVIFSIGAVIGAVITMYAAVSNRTVEIGTLRSLGFRRSDILFAFLIESIILSLIGGAIGIGLVSFMSAVRISTVNFGTFSELAFGFSMSPMIAVASLMFALLMGFVGGFFPAVRAARLNIVNALRSS